MYMGSKTYQRERIAHWNKVASEKHGNIFSRSYHQRLEQVYAHQIPVGADILELGSGDGDLLAALKPAYGVGVDFSPQQIDVAKRRHPQLVFLAVDVQELATALPPRTFDFIVLSDLVNDLYDVQATLQALLPYCGKRTRLIFNYYSGLWQPILGLAQALGLAKANLQQNWLTREDLTNLLNLVGCEVIKHWAEVLLPVPIPLLAPALNRFVVKMWPFNSLALANFIVARPQAKLRQQEYRVSVIVPARNEAGNIEDILLRTPEMGSGTEIVFVEGHSTDHTYQAIEDLCSRYPQRKTQLLQQDGQGKGDAVRKGFSAATGDVLMILDADLTVPPETLPRFYEALVDNRGEFINGTRLVYPMEKEAMRFLNLLGNKFFSLAFAYLLGQSIKDTLCGTKVLFKEDYELIVANRAYFGNFDPFGDYDLLFGAARLGLKIVDLPIRYRERTYGSTNIHRWKHGWLLLKMVAFAAGRIKYV
jgi:SAM-dependent methyltransferase